jgi:hypothetical protein
MTSTDVKDLVKEKYGEAARRASAGARSSFCGSVPAAESCCS